MKFNFKKILFITSLHFICGSTFAQEVPAPKPTTNPEPPQIYDIVDQPAEYPGGMAAMNKFIAENLKYPETAKEKGIQGKCYLQFIVSETGQVSNIKVKKGVVDCKECDLEAVRVVKAMPKWKPGQKDGKNVNMTYTLPVSFKP
ncbi:MAG: TonB family protein [Fluviicola sp.]|jgi:protein TonB|uniref:energy transducer TonB n=1 Tax=Fluviicola sp. TaxID=1917219 RepID=UPI0026349C3A|nr:energy transducer TonB [Fluviicola sp.]MDF3028449.1 TonB family protein [Fluviicola sp.]